MTDREVRGFYLTKYNDRRICRKTVKVHVENCEYYSYVDGQ